MITEAKYRLTTWLLRWWENDQYTDESLAAVMVEWHDDERFCRSGIPSIFS